MVNLFAEVWKLKFEKNVLDDTSAFFKLSEHFNLEYLRNHCFQLLSSNLGSIFLLTDLK